MKYIDAHVHVWTNDFNRYPLCPPFRESDMRPKTFYPEELLAHAEPSGVNRIVLIQMSYYQFDNSYMLDVIEGYPGVFSGIAIVDWEGGKTGRNDAAACRAGRPWISYLSDGCTHRELVRRTGI